MAKSNIRSMRFSDEVIELIEQQVGESFTAKFEALVTRCCFELPRKQEELNRINQQIEEARKRLSNISSQTYKTRDALLQLERVTDTAYRQLERITKEISNL